MVEATTPNYEITIKEWGAISESLVYYGDLRFRTALVRHFIQEARAHMKRGVVENLDGTPMPKPQSVFIPRENMDEIINVLRQPVEDKSAYIVGQPVLEHLIDNYDDLRSKELELASPEPAS